MGLILLVMENEKEEVKKVQDRYCAFKYYCATMKNKVQRVYSKI